MFVSFLSAAASGFGPPLLLGQTLTEYYLLTHVGGSTVFAFCFAVYCIMAAHDARFAKRSLNVNDGSNNQNNQKQGNPSYLRNTFFWLMILAALSTFISVFVCMFPFLKTETQKFMFEVHLWSAWVLSVSVMLHAFLSIVSSVRRKAT